MHSKEEKMQAFGRLLDIMDELREKCPWDRKQTFESLRHLTLEEAYELSEAIQSGNMEEIKKEMGDVLLHIVFYARIADEQHAFDIADVIHQLCDKLIRRHPHVYGNLIVENEEEVKQNWEQLKQQEGQKSALSGVPRTLPALIKAIRIQEKARAVGFDWEHAGQVIEKVHEELQEFCAQVSDNQIKNPEQATAEFGDLLFSLINYARLLGINPEAALEHTNQKFIDRFQYIEQKAQQSGRKLHNMTLKEMEALWQEAKQFDRQPGH